MKRKKTLFLFGICAGLASFAACLADMEMAQYITAFVTLTAFALSDRSGIPDNKDNSTIKK